MGGKTRRNIWAACRHIRRMNSFLFLIAPLSAILLPTTKFPFSSPMPTLLTRAHNQNAHHRCPPTRHSETRQRHLSPNKDRAASVIWCQVQRGLPVVCAQCPSKTFPPTSIVASEHVISPRAQRMKIIGECEELARTLRNTGISIMPLEYVHIGKSLFLTFYFLTHSNL